MLLKQLKKKFLKEEVEEEFTEKKTRLEDYKK